MFSLEIGTSRYLTFMGKPFGVKGIAKFSSVAKGWGVLATAKLEIEGLGAYEEADLLVFDRSEKLYHFFAVTNRRLLTITKENG